MQRREAKTLWGALGAERKTRASLSQTGGAPLGGYRLYMNTGRDVRGSDPMKGNGLHCWTGDQLSVTESDSEDVTSLVYDGSDKPSARAQ